jgi:hypothetical protein
MIISSMLFRQRFLDGIRDGVVTAAFRRWHRPSVRSDGTLLTPVGELSILSVSEIALSEISEEDARRAGYTSLDELLEELNRREDGMVYRIEFGPLRPDPRVAMRESAVLTTDEHRKLLERLQRLDAHSSAGPWTIRTLELIASRPGVRAGDLCRVLGQEKMPFKVNVRKLKNLGLTESLEVGYRLSPRGAAFLRAAQ